MKGMTELGVTPGAAGGLADGLDADDADDAHVDESNRRNISLLCLSLRE